MKRRQHVTHLDAVPQGVLLCTKEQMAAAMQISVRSLTEMMRNGEISYLRIRTRTVRFRAADAVRGLRQTTEANPGGEV